MKTVYLYSRADRTYVTTTENVLRTLISGYWRRLILDAVLPSHYHPVPDLLLVLKGYPL